MGRSQTMLFVVAILVKHVPQGWHDINVFMRQRTQKGCQKIDLFVQGQLFVDDKALLVFHGTEPGCGFDT